MALGALDLLLDADCARIWVRSEIRQKLRRVATVHASAPPSRPSRSILALKRRLPWCSSAKGWLCFPSPSGHLFQGVPCSLCASSPIPKLPVDSCFVILLSSLHLLCRAAE
ncbi:unnamed protein product [Brassica napus]|uniref:(rape) hypothetical protein n=1 Tax=Brassica napus TaxID=3708 RepID=A0A816TMC5_BRANA|nr:unnamed protein product [Brassica napus]